jgi:thioredoxin reductase (NADPH)
MNIDVVIVGGGPCGLSAAISLQEEGLNVIVIEKGNVVDAIYKYPTHQQFFSTSERLEIGEVPFIIEGRKPKRNQALAYYREVVKRKNVKVHTYEKVERVTKETDARFLIDSVRKDGTKFAYKASYVVIATGYYDSPNMMNVPGENLDKVFHYFKEAHPYFNTNVAVIGGKNSAVDTALELEKAGAKVTVLYRGFDYSSSVKPWVLPEFITLADKQRVQMVFNANLVEIKDNTIKYERGGELHEIENDFVFAMTGYHPEHSFLRQMGVQVATDTGRPEFNEVSMETNVEGIFIAGVIAAGDNANEIFIENGRLHGPLIATEITKRESEQTNY